MPRTFQYAVIFVAMARLCSAQSDWSFRQDGVGSVLPDGSWAVVNQSGPGENRPHDGLWQTAKSPSAAFPAAQHAHPFPKQ